MDTRLFTKIADALVGEPDKVRVREERQRTMTVLYAQTNPDDYGKLIGAGGATVEALRVVAALAGIRRGAKVGVKIQEPPMRADPDMTPFIPAIGWTNRWLRELAQETAQAIYATAKVTAEDGENGDTTLTATIGDDEPQHLTDAQVARALAQLFRCIGLANGRKTVRVELRRGMTL